MVIIPALHRTFDVGCLRAAGRLVGRFGFVLHADGDDDRVRDIAQPLEEFLVAGILIGAAAPQSTVALRLQLLTEQTRRLRYTAAARWEAGG